MDSSTRRRRRAARTIAAGAGLAFLLTGCGFDAQTLQPYTPANGVNVDVATGQADRVLKVRNLVVVAGDDGSGVVSASIISPVADRLVSVSGTVYKADATPGAPLTATLSPVTLQPNQLAVLSTAQSSVRVSSPDLEPGLTAQVKLSFASGAEATAVAPVVGFSDPIYATLSPSPSATPTASAGPASTPGAVTPSPTPTTP